MSPSESSGYRRVCSLPPIIVWSVMARWFSLIFIVYVNIFPSTRIGSITSLQGSKGVLWLGLVDLILNSRSSAILRSLIFSGRCFWDEGRGWEHHNSMWWLEWSLMRRGCCEHFVKVVVDSDDLSNHKSTGTYRCRCNSFPSIYHFNVDWCGGNIDKEFSHMGLMILERHKILISERVSLNLMVNSERKIISRDSSPTSGILTSFFHFWLWEIS